MRLVYEHLTDIPSNFTEVEYLESSGTQYIDTGYKFTSNMRFKINHTPTGSISDNYFTGHYATNNKIFLGGFYQNKCIWGIGQLQENTINASANQRFVVDMTYTSNSSANTSSVSGTINGQSVSLTSTALQDFVYGLNILAFARNNNGSVGHYLSCKLYSFQIYNSDTLVRDFVPCLDNNNIPCLYDKVEGKAYYNAGTGSFTYGRKIIPVVYLETSGTQYIDTGIKGNGTTKVEIKYQYPQLGSSAGGSGRIFGSRTSASQNNLSFGSNSGNLGTANDRYFFGYNDYDTRDVSSTLPLIDTRPHIFYYNNAGFKIDGTIYWSRTAGTFTTPTNMKIFGFDQGGTMGYGHGRAYYCKIWDDTTPVRDFIPCKDENNVGFMFDRLTHTVYLNAGSGSFITGSVKPKKKLRLIRESKRRLPKGFKEVEYLAGSGTQYIDTGFAGNQVGKITATLKSDDTSSSSDGVPIGCGSGDNRVQIYSGKFASPYWICRDDGTMITSNVPINDLATIIFDLNNKKCTFNGTTQNYTATGSITSDNLLLYRRTIGGPADAVYIGRIYRIEIWDKQDNLVRDFIPCLDTSNIPCMYDLVEGKAYYNAGTGSFTYGHTITPVEYLESTGTQYIDTWYAFTDNFSWEIDFEGIQDNTILFGGRTSSVRTALLYQRVEGSFVTTCPIAGLNGAATPFQLSDLRTGRHTVKMAVNENKGSVWEDGVQLYNETSFTGTYISGTTQALFADKFGTNDYREQTSSKVYGLKMWQGVNLVRDYIPVKDENNVGYMFDKVTHSLYANAGTGAFVVGNEIKQDITRFIKDEVPNIYRKVSYLESSGTQYINTGYKPNTNTECSIDFMFNTIDSTYRTPLSVRTSDGAADSFTISGASTTQNAYAFGYQRWWDGNGGCPMPVVGTKYNGTLKSGRATFGSVVGNAGTTITPSSLTAYMFARNANGTAANFFKGRIYGCLISENNSIIHKYIPVVRKSDNKPGMYDRVSKQFFTNAGTGEFIIPT